MKLAATGLLVVMAIVFFTARAFEPAYPWLAWVKAFAEAGIRSPRVRTIAGRPRDVVGRLTDHAYDLVSFPAQAPHALDLLEHARRLLRPGGVLVIPHALFHDRVADPAARDADTQSVRAVLKAVSAADDLVSVLTGSGDGVLAAVLRG